MFGLSILSIAYFSNLWTAHGFRSSLSIEALHPGGGVDLDEAQEVGVGEEGIASGDDAPKYS